MNQGPFSKPDRGSLQAGLDNPVGVADLNDTTTPLANKVHDLLEATRKAQPVPGEDIFKAHAGGAGGSREIEHPAIKISEDFTVRFSEHPELYILMEKAKIQGIILQHVDSRQPGGYYRVVQGGQVASDIMMVPTETGFTETLRDKIATALYGTENHPLKALDNIANPPSDRVSLSIAAVTLRIAREKGYLIIPAYVDPESGCTEFVVVRWPSQDRYIQPPLFKERFSTQPPSGITRYDYGGIEWDLMERISAIAPEISVGFLPTLRGKVKSQTPFPAELAPTLYSLLPEGVSLTANTDTDGTGEPSYFLKVPPTEQRTEIKELVVNLHAASSSIGFLRALEDAAKNLSIRLRN